MDAKLHYDKSSSKQKLQISPGSLIEPKGSVAMNSTTKTKPRIEIVKITSLPSGRNLRAFVTVRLGAITIHDFRVVQQPGKDPWVSPPQKEVNRAGERKFYPVVEIGKDLKAMIDAEILSVWRNTASEGTEEDDVF